jgi:hypothetical protein
MTEILRLGAPILFMKVGKHAGESLDDIIRRKRREIEESGFALWGYGGSTCHPLSTVQPFARDFELRGQAIYLLMEPMTSRHFAPQTRATEQSADGLHWDPIPSAINVIGSRYALRITDLHEDDFQLPLFSTVVAAGKQTGRPGDQYVTGRVDKACLEVVKESDKRPDPARSAHIRLVARVVDPYAVFVRNAP